MSIAHCEECSTAPMPKSQARLLADIGFARKLAESVATEARELRMHTVADKLDAARFTIDEAATLAGEKKI